MSHVPVMLDEVLEALKPTANGRYVDGTFGAGSYSRAIALAAECRVIALDHDPDTQPFAQALRSEIGERFQFIEGNFADMRTLLANAAVEAVDGVVLDLGVSSMQLDRAERGFSFQKDGPLDMRMAKHGPSAAELVNSAEEEELARILYVYGEESSSRRIAREIIRVRAETPIVTTKALAELVARVVGRKNGKDPATRTFQALRMAVNGEMDALARGLEAATQLLKPNATLVVVTFHSLEDRVVKRFMQHHAGEQESTSRHLPAVIAQRSEWTYFYPQLRKAKPSAAEVRRNPRARSALLRTATRNDKQYTVPNPIALRAGGDV